MSGLIYVGVPLFWQCFLQRANPGIFFVYNRAFKPIFNKKNMYVDYSKIT